MSPVEKRALVRLLQAGMKAFSEDEKPYEVGANLLFAVSEGEISDENETVNNEMFSNDFQSVSNDSQCDCGCNVAPSLDPANASSGAAGGKLPSSHMSRRPISAADDQCEGRGMGNDDKPACGTVHGENIVSQRTDLQLQADDADCGHGTGRPCGHAQHRRSGIRRFTGIGEDERSD